MLIGKGLTPSRALAALACLLASLASSDKFFEQRGKSCNSETLTRHSRVSSFAACKQKCLDYEGLCLALDYNSDDEMCYLKYECDNLVSKRNNDAAVRDLQNYVQLSGFGCGDETLKTMTDTNSMTDCKDECDDDPDCRVVTRNTESKKCFLKASCDKEKSEDDNESALKVSEYWDRDDYGCDDPNQDRKELEVASTNACKWACEEDVQCRAATFSSSSGTCYLSETCEQVKAKDDNDLVVKRNSYQILEKTGCTSTTLRRSVQTESTFDECMYACDSYASCDAFTFNTDEKQCYLKYTACDHNERKDKDDNISAIKKGRKGCYDQITRVCYAR